MENSIEKMRLIEEISKILDQTSSSNHHQSNEQIEELLLMNRNILDNQEAKNLINEIYNSKQDDEWNTYQDEVLTDLSSRLGGFCPPDRKIDL